MTPTPRRRRRPRRRSAPAAPAVTTPGDEPAALEPAGSDALYFVLSPDCRSHVFTADYTEFLRAKERQCRR